jgi:prophage antirepressor-like protein
MAKETGLQVFENEKFGNVRVVIRDGEPWFVAADVCRALELDKTWNALQRLDDDEKDTTSISTLGGKQDLSIVNEPGLYSLVLGSRKPEAKIFKRWITHDIIPTIRKTGGYIANDDLFVETYLPNADNATKALFRNNLSLIRMQNAQIDSLTDENRILSGEILEWADRSLLVAIVRQYSSNVYGDFARGWNDFKREILYRYSINLNSRITKYLNNTGKKTKPKTTEMLHDDEVPNALSTIVAMCMEKNIDISDTIKNRKEQLKTA